MGLLEFQQGQKIKKMGCWSSSKAENEKNGLARKIARLKNGKNGVANKLARLKMEKTRRREIRKIEKFYLRIDFLSWRQNANRLTLQTKKIKTKFHD
ncbi:MAG: hypothetical protein HXO23_04765 [Prevotella sp.]|nr:hypothetical protein [Prevotella sp.]